jgi:hypothetical protein
MFSILDQRNSFGTSTADGELPNQIYTGRMISPNGDQTQNDAYPAYSHPRPATGGEIAIPYFVEFCATDGIEPPTAQVTLNVYGAEENDSISAPASGWVLVGSMQIPAGKWKAVTRPRVAVSSNEYKWFKCSVAGSGSAHIRADLMRYSS